jgi:nitrogen-specific signal transduction histidine kinase
MTGPKLRETAANERARLEKAELLGPGLIHEMRHPLVGIKAGLELISRRFGAEVTDLDDWQMVATQMVRLEELFRSYQQLFAAEPAAAARFPVESVVQRAHVARQAMQRTGGDVRLVELGEARRLPWAITEFAIEMVEG